MANYLVIGIGAGIASAVLFFAAGNLTILSFALFLAAPLPLFIAGLGWGTMAAVVGGLAGAALTTLLFGFYHGLIFFLAIAVAPVVLCRFAHLSRPLSEAEDRNGNQDGEREWYPMGNLVLWSAGIAGTLVALSIFATGMTEEAYLQRLTTDLETVIKAEPRFAEIFRTPANADQLTAYIRFFVRITPMVTAAVWTAIMVGNIWIAAKVLKMSQRDVRPWAPFPDLALPRLASIALAGAIVGAMIPGTLGFIAEGYASSLLCAFAILGMAVLHYITRGYPGRGFILATAYFSLFMFNWLAAILFAVLGIAELGFGLRARQNKSGSGGAPT